jgi:ABC-type transport system involved in cytochrome c biogenesis permease subunit
MMDNSTAVLYQKVHPFRWAWILYAAAGIVLLVLREGKARTGYRLAWMLVAGGFLLQAAGLASRVLIAGRPPVTNMYESVIWVAFGTILFALLFELRFRAATFLLGAIPVAVASLILADSQPVILDTSIHPLTPVLRDNFWLTTHVLTITLSYAAFALALGVAHVALAQVIRGRTPSGELYGYLYKTLQVGVLLLAIGTILGGVWANYSWGRFWDWDPKETWALTALLGYLFLLHGRISGMWGGFGLAIGSVLAFQSVLMAWYGVNFILGAGLHSYGFGSGGFPLVAAFVACELLFTGAALLTRRRP